VLVHWITGTLSTMDHWYTESERVVREPVAVSANIARTGDQAPPFRLSSSAGRVMARSCAAVCLLLMERARGGERESWVISRRHLKPRNPNDCI